MKAIAHSIILLSALMWIATPFVLAYKIAWWFVGDWFIVISPDITASESVKLGIVRTGILLTAVHVVISAFRILSKHSEATRWLKTKLAFNILLALFWLFAGTIFASFYGYYLSGSVVLLWIPCLTPLSTGLFFAARSILSASQCLAQRKSSGVTPEGCARGST